MKITPHRLLTSLLFVALVGTASAQSSQNWNWNHVNDDSKMSVNMSGEIEFSDDDARVTNMSRRAHIRIRSEERRRDWRLDIERDGGTIEYDFREDGDRIPYEQARDKIAELLLYVIRESGINADKRVARLLREGGPNAVFTEVTEIRSSGSSARYLRELVDQGDLSTANLRELAKQAVQQVPSSGDRARLLIFASPVFMADSRASTDWLDAVRTIPSSGDKARTLIHSLQSEVSARAFTQLLEVARTISSSGDKSRVLLAAVGQFRNEAAVRTSYFETVRSISSSGDKSRVLIGTARGTELDDASLIALLEIARTVSSSGDKSRVLISVSGDIEGESLEAAFLDAADSISSSGDRSRTLRALLLNS